MLPKLAWTLSLLTALGPVLAPPASAHDIAPPQGDVEVRLVCGGGCDEVRHRGQRYVVGERGVRYGIALSNRSGRWVEVVVSVDGRDVVDGYRVSARSRGYLLAPGQSYTIEGWRTSEAEVAAFRFSSVGDSYVGRLGEGHQAGVVRVDVYPERARPRPVPHPDPWRRGVPEPWDDTRAPAPESGAADREEAPRKTEAVRRDDDGRNLGTGWGETRWQPVEERDFVRADPDRPSRTMAILYDDYAGLVARGVLPTRRAWVEEDPPVRWVPPPPPSRDW